MEDVRVVTDPRAVRALAHPLRIAILSELTTRAMTAKQLATLLGEPPARVHYHVKELARSDLIRLTETREKAGILEKYYSAVARRFVVDRTVGNLDPGQVRDLRSAVGQALSLVYRQIRGSLDEPPANTLCLDYGYWTPEEARRLAERLHEVLEEAVREGERRTASGPDAPRAAAARRRYMVFAAVVPVERSGRPEPA